MKRQYAYIDGNIHRITPEEFLDAVTSFGNMNDEKAVWVLGDKEDLYFEVSDDTIHLAGIAYGEHGEDRLELLTDGEAGNWASDDNAIVVELP